MKRKSDSATIATYTYDDQSRRVRKVTTSIAAQGASDKVFMWDGWNLVGELNNSSGTFTAVRYYAWGLDLSGSTQGAGGVGGLVLEKDASSGEGYFPTFDSNGNLVNLVQASSGSTVATYEYDPFGRVLTSSGGYAASNPFRFSTKFQDAETGWNYYGYRYYSADLGRWPNRDPIEERGGINLYGMVGNNAISRTDYLGRKIVTKESNTTFQDAIVGALNAVSGANLFWCPVGKDKWELRIREKGEGSGKLWEDLKKGLNAPLTEFKINRTETTDNAEADAAGIQVLGREVNINENVSVYLPEETGRMDPNGNPVYEYKLAGLDIVLWHELVGHAILKKGHPEEPWNTYEFSTANPLPARWGTVDPTILIENEARVKLGRAKRRPQYYNAKAAWNK